MSPALKLLASCLSISMLSGCASYYSKVSPVRIAPTVIENMTINAAPPTKTQAFTSDLIRGSTGVGVLTDSDSDSAAFVLMAVAAGIGAGSATSGLQIAHAVSGDNGTRAVDSPFGDGVLVDVPSLFATDLRLHKHSTNTVEQRPPQDGLFATPSSVLRITKDKQVFLTCVLYMENYSAGKSVWRHRYRNYSALELSEVAAKDIDPKLFKDQSMSCLRTLYSVFAAHVGGELDESFRPGILMYSKDFGVKGMFLKDEGSGSYMRYTTTIIELTPFRLVQNFTFN